MLGAAVAFSAGAQPGERTYRVGFLGQTSQPEHAAPVAALLEGLREAGYREGANLAIEFRWAHGRLDRLPALASELVRLRPDVIVTHGTPGSLAAKQATATIPIVIAAVGDPVRNGIVASLARPGGNLTGLSLLDADLTAKRMELLKQAVPETRKVAYLSVPGVLPKPVEETAWKERETTARALGLTVLRLWVSTTEDLPRAFSLAVQQGAQAILVQNSSVLRAHASAIAVLAVKHRLPTVGATSFTDQGLLLGYSPRLEDLYRRAGGYVDRILRGARPADLPFEQPTTFEMVVNEKTARALALTIPSPVLQRADRVIIR